MPFYAETILFIFLLIAFGFLAAKSKILSATAGEGISEFVFNLAIPFLLFRTMAFSDFGDSSPWLLWISYFSAVAVTWVAAHNVTCRIFGRDARAGVVSGVAAGFSNLVLLGMPVMYGIFGEKGLTLVSLIISVHLAIMMAVTIILIEWVNRKENGAEKKISIVQLLQTFLKQLLKNPLIIGIICGLSVRYLNIPIPTLGERIVNSFAGIGGTLALFAMGMQLHTLGVRGQIKAAITITSLKLFLMPAVALLSAWIFQLDQLPAMVVVISACMPTGVNSWLIANRFNTGQRLASTTMTLTSGSALFTTVFWISVAQYVFG